MNKRIEELALKSGLINYVDNETPRRYFIDGNADLEELEKFAELIVRECIQICQSEYNEFTEIAAKNNGRESDFAFGRIDSAERIKENIKEHFGVE